MSSIISLLIPGDKLDNRIESQGEKSGRAFRIAREGNVKNANIPKNGVLCLAYGSGSLYNVLRKTGMDRRSIQNWPGKRLFQRSKS